MYYYTPRQPFSKYNCIINFGFKQMLWFYNTKNFKNFLDPHENNDK